jgi:hypothetical protein
MVIVLQYGEFDIYEPGYQHLHNLWLTFLENRNHETTAFIDSPTREGASDYE